MRGKVTRRNVVSAPAPRSAETSRSDQSKFLSRALTTAQTKAILKTTCARMIEWRPKVRLSSVKNDRSAIASTTSGMIIGANSTASAAAETGRRSTPSAREVPRTVAMRVEARATTREFRAAPRISGLWRSREYQSSDAPVHTVGRPALLKLKIMSVKIGA